MLIIIGVLLGIGATFFFGAQKQFEDDNAKQVLANAVTSALKSAQSNGSTAATAQNENSFPSYPSLIADMTPEHPNKVITGADWTASNNQPKGTVVIDTTLSGPRHIVMYTQTPEGHVWEVAADTDGKSPVYAMVNTIGAPVNAGPPQIIGDTYVGNTLTTDPGAWLTGSAITYGFQWRRCDTTGSTCSDIPGAINSTYMLTNSDLGTTLKVVVTATNATGSTTATSDKTSVVVRSSNSGPENTNKPTISGTPAEKQTLHNDLTGQQGSWTGKAPITIARQWQRCDATGNNCVDISGATASTYLLVAADIGSTVRVNVIATDANGTSSAASDPTAVIGMAIPIVGAPPPSISGTASDQHILTANNGTWSSSGTITYTYQWRRCDSAGNNCVDIPGATAQTYTLAAVDIGSTIRVIVTATNAGGPQAYTTAQTAVVTSNPPAATVNPSISGSAREGSTLTGNDGSWTGTTPVTFARQWRRCDSAGANCVDIGGATGTSYVLVAADIGATIRYQVKGTNVAGNSTATSSQTAVIQALPPSGGSVSYTPQAVIGTPSTATPSGWTSSVSITYTYQWQLCDSGGANCADIGGATTNTYTPSAGQLGQTLRVVLTATNSGGSNTANSPTYQVKYGIAAGALVAWAGSSVPSGWAIADGSCGYSSTANPDLYTAIGTTYGGTSTNFCLPNLQDRMPLGKTSAGTGSTLGGTGGSWNASANATVASQTFSFSVPAQTISVPSFAAHSHRWDDEGFNHSVTQGNGDGNGANYYVPYGPVYTNSVSGGGGGNVSSPAATATATGAVTETATGSFTNPPYRVIKFLIATTLGANAPCGALWSNAGTSTPSGAVVASGQAATGSLSGCEAAAFGANVPDMRGVFAAGYASAGTMATLDATGGAIAQSGTVTTPNQTFNVSLPAYTVSMSDASHTHQPSYGAGQIWYWSESQQNFWSPKVWSGISASACGYCYFSYPNTLAGNYGTVASTSFGGTFASNSTGASSTSSSTFTAPFLAMPKVAYTSATYSPDTGIITPYAGSTAPNGWLFADGSCVSQTTYSDLYASIGNTYGSGCAAGQFQLPNMRGRFALGQAASGTGSTLGSSGGTLDATPSATVPAWTPTFTVPSHSFSWTFGDHVHGMYRGVDCGPWNGGWGGYNGYCTGVPSNCCTYTWLASGSNNWSSPINSYAAGGQTVTSNAVAAQAVSASNGIAATPVTFPAQNPPFVALNFIIKT